MKKKVKITIGVVAVLLIGLAGFCAWFLSGSGSTEYYAQIDNTRVEQVDSNGGVINFKGSLPYSYTLLSYDENGNEKEITFGTSRELREGAFIRLTVMPVRGVLDWSEVQYDELPTAVQNHYCTRMALRRPGAFLFPGQRHRPRCRSPPPPFKPQKI